MVSGGALAETALAETALAETALAETVPAGMAVLVQTASVGAVPAEMVARAEMAVLVEMTVLQDEAQDPRVGLKRSSGC